MRKTLKICLLALITVISFGLVKVDALSVDSNVSGTVDPNSKLITTRNTFELDTSVNISAYKVLDAFYNESSNVITYEFTSNFKTFLASNATYKNLTVDDYMKLTSNNTTSTVTNSTLDKLLSFYTNYIKTNSVSPDVSNDFMLFLNAGVYLILPEDTMDVYAVMTANMIPEAVNNDWELDSQILSAKVSKAGVTKSVSAIGTISASYGVTDTFKYYIVGTVPTYPTNSTNRIYTITDTLGTGITVSGISSFVISDGATTLTTNSDGTVVTAAGNKVATISISGQKITVTFDVNYITTNNVTIMYEAKINTNAVLGNTGNLNSAVLTYSNDPYGTGTTNATATTTVYTYGIELLAYETGNISLGLANATFDVYTDSGLTKKIGTITTDSTGKGTLIGVAEGTYYLKQTKAPAGYGLANATSMKVKITGSVTGSTEGYYKVEIPIPKSSLLPFTGGSGTIIYSILGLIIVATGITAYVLYKKKNKK